MNNAKDKRIKKLKKKRIWPSILGLFVITIIFAIILVVQLGFNMLDVTQKKVVTSVGRTEPIVIMFEKYEGEQKQTIQDSVSIYIEMTPEIEAVWVSDLNDNKVWSNNDMEPDIEAIGELMLNEEESISLIFEEDFSDIIIFWNKNKFSMRDTY